MFFIYLGSYGNVKEALDIETKKRVAIKICKDKQLRKIPGGKKQVLDETKILEKLHHRNVIKFYEHWIDGDKIYFVLQYLGGGSLNDYLKKQKDKKLSSSQARSIFCDLINGLEYIHDLGIVHGDIKPDNLLLSSRGELKIIDFGVSIELDKVEEEEEDRNEHDNDKSCCLGTRGNGTVAFQPPEVVSGNVKFVDCGVRLDIWAAGVVLYIITIGEYPFKGNSLSSLLDSICSAEIYLPEDLDKNLKDLLKQLLATNSDKPITIQDIKDHP